MTAPSDYEALVEKAATVLRDEVIDAPRAAIIATRALEAAGLPALIERVEAAEGDLARLTSEWNEDELNQQIERLRDSVSSMFHEIELVRHERNTARAERDALAAKVARVEALVEEAYRKCREEGVNIALVAARDLRTTLTEGTEGA